jgi:hypothetical protein
VGHNLSTQSESAYLARAKNSAPRLQQQHSLYLKTNYAGSEWTSKIIVSRRWNGMTFANRAPKAFPFTHFLFMRQRERERERERQRDRQRDRERERERETRRERWKEIKQGALLPFHIDSSKGISRRKNVVLVYEE